MRNLNITFSLFSELVRNKRKLSKNTFCTWPTIVNFFGNPDNLSIIRALREAGVHWSDIDLSSQASQPLQGQTWVITGGLETISRAEAKDRLQDLGAKVASSVSAKTTQVVAGPGAGSKLSKALSLDIAVMDEAQFVLFLTTHSL